MGCVRLVRPVRHHGVASASKWFVRAVRKEMWRCAVTTVKPRCGQLAAVSYHYVVARPLSSWPPSLALEPREPNLCQRRASTIKATLVLTARLAKMYPGLGAYILFTDLDETTRGGEYGISSSELVLDGFQVVLIHHPAEIMVEVKGILYGKPMILLHSFRQLVPPLLPLSKHRCSSYTHNLTHGLENCSRTSRFEATNLIIIIKFLCIKIEKVKNQLCQGFLKETRIRHLSN